MDVTPPSVLRRLGIALAGLAVAALAGAACALSFDDLRALALTGEARQDLAFLYPAAFDALLVVALIGVLLLRTARLLVRLQAALVLVLLIVAAAAVNAATAVRFVFDVRQAAVGVALAPWVMLAVALWLWLLLIKHVQAHRGPDGGEDDGTAEPDIVPFHRGRPAETPPPLVTGAPAPVMESTPLVGPTAAPETPPVPAHEPPIRPQETHVPGDGPRVPAHDPPAPAHDAPISAQVAEWRAEEQAYESAPSQEQAHEPARSPAPVPGPGRSPAPVPEPSRPQEPEQEPADAQEPVHGTTPVHVTARLYEESQELSEAVQPYAETPEEPARGRDSAHEPVQDVPGLQDVPEPAAPQDAEEPRPAPEPKTRPVRWGDRVKPTDVLVHPRPDDRDADTQPHPVYADEVPDPVHGPESADTTERQAAGRADDRSEDELADTAPHPVIHDDTPAPSGRLRSTPRPPED
ncbi:DUF2637 domain-containing protein [Nonomuraea sp. NPDC049480]|uniref:DUF2637 domain-containing protein n=1 Tax=Nonomuraea sp. NPDC049480 TaxID=3364353 RepID=UPI003798109A